MAPESMMSRSTLVGPTEGKLIDVPHQDQSGMVPRLAGNLTSTIKAHCEEKMP